MPKSKPILPTAKVVYCGGGDFLAGLPARDMSGAEWLDYPADLRQSALDLGLYQVVNEEVSNES